MKMRLLAATALALSIASTALPAAASVDCSVTIPNNSPSLPGGGTFISFDGDPPATHGNDQLWVGYLSPDGIIVVSKDRVELDGSIELKFPWARRILEYRTVDGALTGFFAGELEIEVQRLDGPAAPARVTTNPTGAHVGSLITFPTTGCWEVTGRAGADSLSFVFLLLSEGQPMPSTAAEPPEPPLIVLGVTLLAVGLSYAVARLRASRA